MEARSSAAYVSSRRDELMQSLPASGDQAMNPMRPMILCLMKLNRLAANMGPQLGCLRIFETRSVSAKLAFKCGSGNEPYASYDPSGFMGLSWLTADGGSQLWQLPEGVLLLPGHGLQGYDHHRALCMLHHVSGQAAAGEGLLEAVGS